jgi:hypothetical protein
MAGAEAQHETAGNSGSVGFSQSGGLNTEELEMTPRLWVRARLAGARYLLRLHGVLDGSTACQVLDAVAAAPGPVREVVVELEGLAAAEPFGLEVLVRGLPASAGGRTVRVHGAPAPSGLLAG